MSFNFLGFRAKNLAPLNLQYFPLHSTPFHSIPCICYIDMIVMSNFAVYNLCVSQQIVWRMLVVS